MCARAGTIYLHAYMYMYIYIAVFARALSQRNMRKTLKALRILSHTDLYLYISIYIYVCARACSGGEQERWREGERETKRERKSSSTENLFDIDVILNCFSGRTGGTAQRFSRMEVENKCAKSVLRFPPPPLVWFSFNILEGVLLFQFSPPSFSPFLL